MPFILIISVCFISFLFKGHSLRLSTYIAKMLFSKKKKRKTGAQYCSCQTKKLRKYKLKQFATSLSGATFVSRES